MREFGDTPNPAKEASPRGPPSPTTSLVSALVNILSGRLVILEEACHQILSLFDRCYFKDWNAPHTSFISEVGSQIILTTRLTIPYKHCKNGICRLFSFIMNSLLSNSKRFIEYYFVCSYKYIITLILFAKHHKMLCCLHFLCYPVKQCPPFPRTICD